MMGQLTKRESRWNPLTNFQEEMNQLVSQFFGENGGASERQLMSPNLDLSETDGEIEVRLDLPGFKPEEIDVDLSHDVLTISGEHKEEKEEKDEGRRYHRIERRRGSFQRIVQLPAMVQEDKIDATFQNGVLTITMPKSEESKSKKIRVKG